MFLGFGALWSVGLAGGLVVAVRVEGEFAEDLSGGGVDDPDVKALYEQQDVGSCIRGRLRDT